MIESIKSVSQATMVSMIVRFVQWYVGTGVFDRIRELVLEMSNDERSSDQKREYVIQSAKSEFDTIRTHIVDLAISTVLTSIR